MTNQTTNLANAELAERIVNRFMEEVLGLPVTLAAPRLAYIVIEELEQASFAGAISYGAALIARERERQVEGEGFTGEHDDRWTEDQLIDAAICYLFPTDQVIFDMHWPWDEAWWKPKDRVSDLVRAGALIAAELDRLHRATIGDARAPAGRSQRPQRRPDYDAETGNVIPDSWVPPRDWDDDNRLPFDDLGETDEWDEWDDTAPDEVAEAVDLDLGLCCACLKNPATGFAFLPVRAPVPGTGWGCLACGLPQDGAMAVLCEVCGESGADINEVCYGQAGDRQRVAFSSLGIEPFEHDYSKHPEYEYDGTGWATPPREPTAPPPDDTELLRLMVESFEGAPAVNLQMSAFEAFNMVGLMQLCLRLDLPPNVKATALELARRFEGKVNEAAPGLEEMMGLGYDERHDRDASGRPIHPQSSPGGTI